MTISLSDLILAHLAAHGPSTPAQLSRVVIAPRKLISQYLHTLKARGKVAVVGTCEEEMRHGRAALVWGLVECEPSPPAPDIVKLALDAQPELARVWA